MTQARDYVLLRLIAADRAYRIAAANGESCSRDDRGVEIGWINGVARPTAVSLEKAGLAEIVQVAPGRDCLFLGSYDPQLPIED